MLRYFFVQLRQPLDILRSYSPAEPALVQSLRGDARKNHLKVGDREPQLGLLVAVPQRREDLEVLFTRNPLKTLLLVAAPQRTGYDALDPVPRLRRPQSSTQVLQLRLLLACGLLQNQRQPNRLRLQLRQLHRGRVKEVGVGVSALYRDQTHHSAARPPR